LPAGYETDLEGRASNVITFKRLVLELSGLLNEVKENLKSYEARRAHRLYLHLKVKTQEGAIVDAVDYILDWLDSGRRTALVLWGKADSGKLTVAKQSAYESQKRLVEGPEHAVVLCSSQAMSSIARVHARDWALPFDSASISSPAPGMLTLWTASEEPAVHQATSVERIELLSPSEEETQGWFLRLIDAVPTKERFVKAWGQEADLRALACVMPNLPLLLKAAATTPDSAPSATVVEWMVRVVHRYVESMLHTFRGRMRGEELSPLLEQAALEQFALGRAPSLDGNYSARVLISSSPALGSWFERVPDATASPQRSGARDSYIFSSEIISHCFIARKIATEVREGRTDILSRYQLPRAYVLLFLAVISPEAASIATAERGEQIREQIEAEVERRLQLTLAHALKRSAGAVRAHVNTLRRRLPPEERESLAYELRRIDEEIEFQRALAEQTRRWHEVPEASIEAVPVAEIALSSVERSAANHPGVTHRINIDPDLRIRASRDLLREILDCLVENAFEAVVFAEGIATPRVAVRARAEGDTVRIDVIDNGPGVAPRDRDLIFDLYVTTKKGGDRKPLGTGMGLPIARRYAEHVGGQVGLDPSHEGTCFFARFVAWKELS
jgi:signal transduction histidine kinase